MNAVVATPRPLLQLAPRQCRYPIAGDGDATHFCAVEVAPGEWMPGRVGGCYCAAHRAATSHKWREG